MQQNPIISLKNVHKSFGGVSVLNGVDFDLQKGSVHALVGQNGAGKSTMMKILTGVYTCDSGAIYIDGSKVKMNSYSDAVSHGISLIFQELSLIPTLTVAENIFLNREILEGPFLDKKSMERKAHELLQSLDIDVDVHSRVEDLDVGVCQMIEIAKALSVNAKVLILDEPTASLSEKETAHLFTLINSLKQRGVSMIYISHRMAEIFKICDTITVLRNGSIVTTKPTRDYSLTGLIEDMIGRKTAALTTADEELASKCTGRPLMTVEHLNCGSRLKDVSFELREGEVLGLAGLMGSGRTEVVESLFGLNKGASGQVTINGQPYEIKGVRHAIDSGLALIPEDRRREGLVLMHSVEENLIVPIFDKLKRGLLLESKKVADIAERSISDMAIKTRSRKTPAFNLSGGNQQKIVVGKWLNSAPSVLLLDEPTAGVDVGSKREIIDKVRDFVGENRAAIFISSDILELISACDRFIVFYDGKVTATYNRSEITEEVLQYAIQNEC
jgi:ribose transport system ATP-binding protein